MNPIKNILDDKVEVEASDIIGEREHVHKFRRKFIKGKEELKEKFRRGKRRLCGEDDRCYYGWGRL